MSHNLLNITDLVNGRVKNWFIFLIDSLLTTHIYAIVEIIFSVILYLNKIIWNF